MQGAIINILLLLRGGFHPGDDETLWATFQSFPDGSRPLPYLAIVGDMIVFLPAASPCFHVQRSAPRSIRLR